MDKPFGPSEFLQKWSGELVEVVCTRQEIGPARGKLLGYDDRGMVIDAEGYGETFLLWGAIAKVMSGKEIERKRAEADRQHRERREAERIKSRR